MIWSLFALSVFAVLSHLSPWERQGFLFFDGLLLVCALTEDFYRTCQAAGMNSSLYWYMAYLSVMPAT